MASGKDQIHGSARKKGQTNGVSERTLFKSSERLKGFYLSTPSMGKQNKTKQVF